MSACIRVDPAIIKLCWGLFCNVCFGDCIRFGPGCDRVFKFYFVCACKHIRITVTGFIKSQFFLQPTEKKSQDTVASVTPDTYLLTT